MGNATLRMHMIMIYIYILNYNIIYTRFSIYIYYYNNIEVPKSGENNTIEHFIDNCNNYDCTCGSVIEAVRLVVK